jgi:hypothetical protein
MLALTESTIFLAVPESQLTQLRGLRLTELCDTLGTDGIGHWATTPNPTP